MSKFQIVKGITDNLTETPYVEGKVYFVYDDIASTDLSIYADIDGARRKITPTTFEEEDPKIHILTLQENENEELTTGEDESISGYVNNNELVIIYYNGMPYFYNKNSDRGRRFEGIDGNSLIYMLNKWTITDTKYITEEIDPTVHVITLEHNWDADLDVEVTSLPTGVTYENINTWTHNNEIVVLDAGESEAWRYYYFASTDRHELTFMNLGGDKYSVYDNNSVNFWNSNFITRSDLDNSNFLKSSITNNENDEFRISLSGNGTTTVGLYTDFVFNNGHNTFLPLSIVGNGTTGKVETKIYGIVAPTSNDMPTNKEYVDNAVSDKMTSTEVNSAIATAIGNINQFNVAIVSTLPTENIDAHTIYFMSNGGSDDSIYDEWMYINNNWEKIGTTSIDLSGYMQTSHPANGITSTDISNWNKKSNLWTVRSDKSGSEYYWILEISQNNLWKLNNAPGYNSGIGRITLPVNRNGNVYSNVQLQLPITNGTIALTSDIPDVSGYVSKSGDTMSGDLSFADGKGIELNYSGYKDKLYLIGYGPSTRTASFEYKTELRNIQAPTTDSAAANKEYVDNAIPKVYSSTNTNGYLTMATLPIYDGTVE